MTVVPTAVLQQQRAVRGMPFTAAFTFGLDGDALPDAGSVSVSIVNAAGTVVASGAATLGAISGGQQTATFALAANLTPARDLFTCTWTAAYSGVQQQLVSTIDVCDSRLFPLSDYAQFAELSSFTSAQQEQQRMLAEDFLERECGMAFTGRYRSQSFSLDEPPDLTWWPDPPMAGWGGGDQSYGRSYLVLDRPFVLAIRSITQTTLDDNGNPTTTSLSLSFARFDGTNGVLIYKDNLGNGIFGDAVVGYEHGATVPDVRRVCLILARYRLLNGPLEARAVAMPIEGGGNARLQSPDAKAMAPTGITEVDTFIARYNRNATGFVSGL